MKREEFWELSLVQLGALLERWERDRDERAPTVRAYLEAATEVGADVGVHEGPRHGVFAVGTKGNPATERYRTAVEARAFGLGESSTLEITWSRGVARHVVAYLAGERPSLAELARVLRHPSARFIDSVGLHAKVGPATVPDLDAAFEGLRDRIVTPRIWSGKEDTKAWVDALAALPRIRCRLAPNDPSHDVFIGILARGGAPKEMHLELANLATGGSRGLDAKNDACTVEANASLVAEYARRAARVFITAVDLDLDDAIAVLDVMPRAFDDGGGLLAHHDELGVTTLTTAAGPYSSGARLVFPAGDEVELRASNGTRLWSSSESATFAHQGVTYQWIARDLSEHVRSRRRQARE